HPRDFFKQITIGRHCEQERWESGMERSNLVIGKEIASARTAPRSLAMTPGKESLRQFELHPRDFFKQITIGRHCEQERWESGMERSNLVIGKEIASARTAPRSLAMTPRKESLRQFELHPHHKEVVRKMLIL